MEEAVRIKTALGVTARYRASLIRPCYTFCGCYFPVYTAEDLCIYLFTEKGQEIQNVPTFQKSVKGKMKQCRITDSLLCSRLRICLCNDFHFVGQVY